MQKVEDFLSEMFRITGSDFALLTPAVDRKAKNQGPMSHSYQGIDFALGVPGLYWINPPACDRENEYQKTFQHLTTRLPRAVFEGHRYPYIRMETHRT
jgi:hypothetical protein